MATSCESLISTLETVNAGG